MPVVEIWALLAVLLLGAGQVLFLRGDAAQISRNFAETFPSFLGALIGLTALNGFGEWSQEGAVVYAIGRYAYLILTLTYPKVRKWAWALSIIGLAACLAELTRALMMLI
jgi:uncharacterized MAPEG superfamily protein